MCVLCFISNVRSHTLVAHSYSTTSISIWTAVKQKHQTALYILQCPLATLNYTVVPWTPLRCGHPNTMDTFSQPAEYSFVR